MSRFDGKQFLGTDEVGGYLNLLRSYLPEGHAVFPPGIWLVLTNYNREEIKEVNQDRLDYYATRDWFRAFSDADIIYVPIVVLSHWILATIDYSSHTIEIYNSIRSYPYRKEVVHENLEQLAYALKPEGTAPEWTFTMDEEGCKQTDSYNCGVHVLQRIRDNVLGDIPRTLKIDELRAYLGRELRDQSITLFETIDIPNGNDTPPADEFDALETYLTTAFETVAQLVKPSRKRLGMVRVNQPVKDSPSYLVKYVVDGNIDRIKEAYRQSLTSDIDVYGVVYSAPGPDYDASFIGLLEADD